MVKKYFLAIMTKKAWLRSFGVVCHAIRLRREQPETDKRRSEIRIPFGIYLYIELAIRPTFLRNHGLPFELILRSWTSFSFSLGKHETSLIWCSLAMIDVFCFDSRNIQPKGELRNFNTLTFRRQIYLNYHNSVDQWSVSVVVADSFKAENCKY